MRRQNGVIRLRLQHRMDRETELQIIRSACAKRVMSAAGIRELRATFDKGGAERRNWLLAEAAEDARRLKTLAS
jgi:hypothetical protein